MPRKKQGLRSYHHKSRNGCAQCKRRRVKCTMQTPACANCVRRNELCEYATFIDRGSALEPQLHFGMTATTESWFLPQGTSAPSSGESTTLPGDTNLLLSVLFSHSWFSPQEKAIWLPALSKLAVKHTYLQHCILALTNLREEQSAGQLTRTPVAAYQHQVTASALFRSSNPSVDEDNWLAVLAFSTCNLIFQLYSQHFCQDADFDLIGTLRIIRSTTDIQSAARPFLRRSELWNLIVIRANIHHLYLDAGLRNAIKSLERIVSAAIESANDDDGEETAEISRQAFCELREWASQSEGEPRRWDQYCSWPSKVTPEFLDLLADDDDVALLIFVHWAAIMHRSCKPVVRSWAKRVAFYAIDRLQDTWGEQLAWPLQVFSPSPPSDASFPLMDPLLADGANPIDPELLPASTVNSVTTSLPSSSYEPGINPASHVHPAKR
ncbi:hypothetical protein K458DRAFT_403644 [Lentithecium fluviatile CBS 122367]|uniref:Zn(2)-C6 fungal-type domain-containing protein n=1 Tax=Lentithecium fluviatile CBS 122367 TaxID=1168545 RepID=A0A6G1J4Y0_9PLEO|nr:hypothetical protein K458DRAFT_403644 [Lentithecium fluviatile CBS 122367]